METLTQYLTQNWPLVGMFAWDASLFLYLIHIHYTERKSKHRATL